MIKRLHDKMQNQIRTDPSDADQLLHDLAWNVLELRREIQNAMPVLHRRIRVVSEDHRP